MSENSAPGTPIADLTLITWPAVVRHEHQQELSFFINSNDWLTEASHSLFVANDAVLIDSNGQLFSLDYDKLEHCTVINRTGQTISLADFETFVKTHLAVMNQCCISKVGLRSYRDGMALVAATLD